MADFLSFEINIYRGEGGVHPVVIRSPQGEAAGEFKPPIDAQALEEARQILKAALIQSGGKADSDQTSALKKAQAFGRTLFETLFTGQINSLYVSSCHEAEKRHKDLCIQLRLEDPDLVTLPWEFLYNPAEREYLCLRSGFPLVRYIPQPRPLKALQVKPPLRILCMMPSPSDQKILDGTAERSRMNQALEALVAQGLVHVHWLEECQSWRNLLKVVHANGPWHAFHFVGHGGFDEARDEGVLAFEDESTRKTDPITATDLVRLLDGAKTLRLVLLNACDTAHTGRESFSSTAATLAQRGIPAVVAMQYPISDRAAIEFSRSFYDLLTTDGRVDTAVTGARKAVSITMKSSLEWATPILYLHTANTSLFKLRSRPGSSQPPVAPPAGSSGHISTGNISGISGGIINLGGGTVIVNSPPPGANLADALNILDQLISAGSLDQAEKTLSQLEAKYPQHPDLISRRAILNQMTAQVPAGNGKLPPPPVGKMFDGDYIILSLGGLQEMKLIHIPAGEFRMGSDIQVDKYAAYDELRQHPVLLPDYWIGWSPVTNAQYAAYIQAAEGRIPSGWLNGRPPRTKLNHPVVDVKWREAMAFCDWLGQLCGYPVRLPTEAEWEKAARGTDARIYPWGDPAPDGTRGNFAEKLGNGGTTPVGSYSPKGDSFYKCVDMAGNVWEWCADRYDQNYYKNSPLQDPPGPDTGNERVVRGGSYSFSPRNARCASRSKYNPEVRLDDLGFRVVLRLAR
ncbi:MAG TPA: SUMF1/EgtB/PvdO family nonheme iron enzyme [Anaerolineaceae bacterium]|nr:SUMF1/EgtB/PvdO family nonheme iron enzyme [Anaerolineaceae bacterium]